MVHHEKGSIIKPIGNPLKSSFVVKEKLIGSPPMARDRHSKKQFFFCLSLIIEKINPSKSGRQYRYSENRGE